MKKDIKTYSKKDLEFYLSGIGEQSFRANQILEWLYVHEVTDFNAMTNLPVFLREKLFQNLVINKLILYTCSKSADNSIKYVLESSIDKSLIECVAIPTNKFLTVCVSTQVGCPMACKFCATGKQGFKRNLSIGEIVDQILFVQKDTNKRVSNVVVMGQGEPFLNYDNLINALDIINNPKGIGIGARKITVSTSGIPKKIKSFSQLPKQYGLAISLHSAIQETRNILMPGVKNYTLQELGKSLNYYSRRITFEYLLLKGVNDQQKDLEALIDFCRPFHCHVNLLPYNKVDGCDYTCSESYTFNQWQKALKQKGIETTIRKSRGDDVNGACGQLLNNVSRETF